MQESPSKTQKRIQSRRELVLIAINMPRRERTAKVALKITSWMRKDEE
jgi:hypothetical protein